MPSVSVPSPRLGGGPGSAPSPDPVEVSFLDRARATHFAEILEGLRVSRASREATFESLRAKRAAGDALTVGERAVLEVDRRCVAQTSCRAALRALETLNARLARWDARGFVADPRFGDAALESCRARLAIAKEDATRTVAAAQPAIAEARRRARERERAALEERLEASKRRQREDRYAFDADLAAARRTERVELELGREHAREREQRRDLDARRDAWREHSSVQTSRKDEAPEIWPTSPRADTPDAEKVVATDPEASADASSSAFLDDTTDVSHEADIEQQRAAWNAELERRRAALEEERGETADAAAARKEEEKKTPETFYAPGVKSGFVVPAHRRGSTLASLFGHALEGSGGKKGKDSTASSPREMREGETVLETLLNMGRKGSVGAVAPELVAKALVAAESGAEAGDARLGASAVALAAASAVLRAVDPGDPNASVPRAFCYGRHGGAVSGGGDTYMTRAKADKTKTDSHDAVDEDGSFLRRDDALCALAELRASQTSVGRETFDATLAYFARLAERRALDVFQASSAMAELLAPAPSGEGAAALRAHAAAKTRLARLARGLFACDDLEAAPPAGHVPFWASRATKARAAAGAVAEKARATRPFFVRDGPPAKGELFSREASRGTLEAGTPSASRVPVPVPVPEVPLASAKMETSVPLGSLLGALDLSEEPRGGDGGRETNLNPNPNPNPNPFRPNARGGREKQRLNLRASAAFSLETKTLETADPDESNELEAALRALPPSAGAGSRDVLRRASTEPPTREAAPPRAAVHTNAARTLDADPSYDSDAFEAEDLEAEDVEPSELSAEFFAEAETEVAGEGSRSAGTAARAPRAAPRVVDRERHPGAGDRRDAPEREAPAGRPPVFSPDASATFSESDSDFSPFSPAAAPAAVSSRALPGGTLPGGPRRRPLSGPKTTHGRSAVGSIVSRALADDSDSSASDASRAAGATAREPPSGALDESDSFDF